MGINLCSGGAHWAQLQRHGQPHHPLQVLQRRNDHVTVFPVPFHKSPPATSSHPCKDVTQPWAPFWSFPHAEATSSQSPSPPARRPGGYTVEESCLRPPQPHKQHAGSDPPSTAMSSPETSVGRRRKEPRGWQTSKAPLGDE